MTSATLIYSCSRLWDSCSKIRIIRCALYYCNYLFLQSLRAIFILLDSINLKAILNYSAEENPCFFFLALLISSVSIILPLIVWHSDYELSMKTQKPFFILKESSKCHNINYRAKNHVVMFCFGLQSIARFINTNASYLNTHRLESEGKFSWNF